MDHVYRAVRAFIVIEARQFDITSWRQIKDILKHSWRCRAFISCESLSGGGFGESSSLSLIGQRTFCNPSVREIHIPDDFEDLLRNVIDSQVR